MTINELITEVDDLKGNQFGDAQKIKWINEVEGRILEEILKKRELDEGMELPEFVEYDENTNMDTELLVPAPYTDLYKYYLFSMIDLNNEEYDRYQNTAVLFNNSYQQFANYWYRTHKANGIRNYLH